MFKEIEGRSSEIIQLARDLIRIPSENPPGNVDKIIDLLTNYLQDNGVATSIVEGAKGKPNLLCETGSKDSSKILLLNGHLDVVPAGAKEEWEFDPFGGEIRDGFICGRGASDMKAGVAGIVFAFIMLHHRRESLRGRVKLQLVPDEDRGPTRN
jgi:succinyl-diaminopimelate desuccinylase